MAFISDIRGYETTLISRMVSTFRSAAEAYENRRRFEVTVRELNALDTHTLDDLGIGRGQIRDAAFQAVYGN